MELRGWGGLGRDRRRIRWTAPGSRRAWNSQVTRGGRGTSPSAPQEAGAKRPGAGEAALRVERRAPDPRIRRPMRPEASYFLPFLASLPFLPVSAATAVTFGIVTWMRLKSCL